jgi:hypothetical protein
VKSSRRALCRATSAWSWRSPTPSARPPADGAGEFAFRLSGAVAMSASDQISESQV